MTEKQFSKQIDRVLQANIALSSELQKLGVMVSSIFEAEYIADICNGSEIEFHPVDKDGYVDDGLGHDNHSTMHEEDVINAIKNKK